MGLFGLVGLLKGISRDAPEAFSAAITGIKLGDRVVFAGSGDIALVAEVARRAGLSGRVVLLAPTADAARDRAARVEEAGGLVEPAHAPLNMLPFDSGGFDVAVAEESLGALSDRDRAGAVSELLRVLRPGGRLLWIERAPRGGLFRAAPDSRALSNASALQSMMTAAGFRGVRTLAEARGRIYLEGIKGNSGVVS